MSFLEVEASRGGKKTSEKAWKFIEKIFYQVRRVLKDIIPNILNPKKKSPVENVCGFFFAIQYLSSNPFRNRSSVRKPIKPNVFADNSGHFFLLFFYICWSFPPSQ